MMEGQLIFCSDSILRFGSDYDETTALSLLSIQRLILCHCFSKKKGSPAIYLI